MFELLPSLHTEKSSSKWELDGGELRDGLRPGRGTLETNPGPKRRKNKHLATSPVNNANLAQPGAVAVPNKHYLGQLATLNLEN